eukprot:COSAG02_NODE_21638_length_780_cov_1.713656_1_plen_35_part_10
MSTGPINPVTLGEVALTKRHDSMTTVALTLDRVGP